MYSKGIDTSIAAMVRTTVVVPYRSWRYQPRRNSNRRYQNTLVNESPYIDERWFVYETSIVEYKTKRHDVHSNIVRPSNAFGNVMWCDIRGGTKFYSPILLRTTYYRNDNYAVCIEGGVVLRDGISVWVHGGGWVGGWLVGTASS